MMYRATIAVRSPKAPLCAERLDGVVFEADDLVQAALKLGRWVDATMEPTESEYATFLRKYATLAPVLDARYVVR